MAEEKPVGWFTRGRESDRSCRFAFAIAAPAAAPVQLVAECADGPRNTERDEPDEYELDECELGDLDEPEEE